MKFRDKLFRFLYGRNGNDALNNLIFWVYFALLIVNLILQPFFFWVGIALWVVELLLLILYLFRALSRNLYRRQAENRRYLKIRGKLAAPFKMARNKFRDRKTHVYKKCKHCRAVLRLPKKKGKHTVRCPKCNQLFQLNI